MASRIPDTGESLREFWASFPHDEQGNVIITELVRGDEIPGVVDPEIQAIIDSFEKKPAKLEPATA